jgi:chromosome segregation ATPase
MTEEYNFLRDLLKAELNPITKSIEELKLEVRSLNEKHIQVKEIYAEDSLTLAARVETLEKFNNTVENKSLLCQNSIETKISLIKSKVESLENYKKPEIMYHNLYWAIFICSFRNIS